jgi:signal transduction histidine kinase
VSQPWRLRHKLVLGLALVLVSVGLLLGGTLLGLSAASDTINVTARKIDEMQTLEQLKDAVWEIGTRPVDGFGSEPASGRENRSTLGRELEYIQDKLRRARETFTQYQLTHEFVMQNRLDPDQGEYEGGQIPALEQAFAALEAAVAQATRPGVVSGDASSSVFGHPEVRLTHATLIQKSNELYAHLREDVRRSHENAGADYRRTRYITVTATGLAVIIVLTLLYYFRVWVFRPIKELQAGVLRVHGGNFDQPIKLLSKDELEELANEFNAMTVRLRDIYSNLAQQVNERTRQLVRSERMVSVGFLAAGIAHEINNPLASILLYSESLESRLQHLLAKSPEEAETITSYLRVIQQESFRCKEITKKLLHFSRSGGKREPVELNRLVNDMLDVARLLPIARGKHLVFQPSADVTALVSEPDVKSVVLNLVVNALDSMDDGGTLTTRVTAYPDAVEMTFTDTGCGMTTEVLENIFEPFFTRNRTGNGTGLGLSISHQIVDQHGGSIHATSEGPGKGSTFVVRIPLRAQEDRRPEKNLPDRPVVATQPKKLAA